MNTKFKKIIWKLFKIKRDDFNSFDRKVEILLMEVFEMGRQEGKREEINKLKNFLR